MKQYFSAKKLGLYPDSILKMYEDAGALPDDLIEITDEQYEEFAGSAPGGKALGATPDGKPCWVDLPSEIGRDSEE